MATKLCSECKEIKDFLDFYPKSRHKIYPVSAAGYSNECKACVNITRRAYRLANKEKTRDCDTNSRLKREYGIDLNQYNQMFTGQNGCCKSCEKHQSELKFRLAVDHCHTSGRVRGLLCQNCNRALGLLKENIKTLNNLINYLSPELAAKSNVVPFEALTKAG